MAVAGPSSLPPRAGGDGAGTSSGGGACGDPVPAPPPAVAAAAFLSSCSDEPGKQVRSAVKIKNISKSHIAFKGGEGWILGGAGQCDQLRHGCSWQWDFDVDRESSAPALVVVLRELGCTPFISICRNLLYIRSFRIDLI
uniref:Uncharacterized protein n=1 Tax=Oryza nivara TaxID=4536 RepID=A0A0E0I9D9_ORYNI